MTTTRISWLFVAAVAAAAILAPAGTALAQAQPSELTIGIYAPTASFSDSAARLSYVQGLAKAIGTKTGIKTEGRAYIRFDDLKKANPDFAIVDGQCIAARRPGTLIATASIGGDTTQRWGLFARGGTSVGALKGKKLAIVRTGCRDEDFIENAMFEGEVKTAYFGGREERPDVAGAVAAVKDYKAADAVFAPAAAAKGLTKIFDSGNVPAPGFLAMKKDLPAPIVDKVKEAVLSYGAGGGIDGWRAASAAAYDGLAGRLGARSKKPIFAMPDLVRLEDEDILISPKSPTDQATVHQHFWEPPERRSRR